MPSHRRLIALLLAGAVLVGLAIWAREAFGPDRYRDFTTPQLEAVLARRPNDAAALHQLGLRYLEERRFTEARRTLERAHAARPGSARIANALGEACAYQHDFVAARGYFEQAAALDPRLAVAHKNLGDMWGVAGNFTGAIEAYRRALSLEPRNIETLAALGSAYADAQNLGKAVETFERALALEPRSAAAYQGLGRAYLRFRDYPKARQALSKAADLDPSDGHTAAFLALAYAEQITGDDDAREALRQLERATSLGYQGASADYVRGLVELYLGHYDRAIAHLKEAKKKDPAAENTRYRLAQAYLVVGDKTAGEREMASYQKLIESRPQLERLRQAVAANAADVEARRRLARLCLQTALYSEATNHFLMLTRLRPDDAEAWKGLAEAAAASGNTALAEQARASLRRLSRAIPPGRSNGG